MTSVKEMQDKELWRWKWYLKHKQVENLDAQARLRGQFVLWCEEQLEMRASEGHTKSGLRTPQTVEFKHTFHVPPRFEKNKFMDWESLVEEVKQQHNLENVIHNDKQVTFVQLRNLN